MLILQTDRGTYALPETDYRKTKTIKMKIEFEKLDEVNGVITVEVDEKDYAEDVKKELKKVSKTHSEPGFRAGKVPFGIIEKKYGKAVKYDVVSKAVGNELYKYIADNKLPVLGQPLPGKENDLNPEETSYKLTFKVGLAPELGIKADKEMHLPYYHIEITDEMIDKQDDHMRTRFGKQVPGDEVDATALVKGEISELDADGKVKEDGVKVENGIVAPQYFKDEEQTNLFIGKHVGDKVVFNPWKTCNGNATEMSSMLNVDKKDVDNYKGDFEFDIKEIIVLKKAEQGEEYYKEAFGENGNVTDDKSYREALKNMLANAMAPETNYRFTIDAREIIGGKVKDTQLPDEVLKEYLVMNNDDIDADNVDEIYNGMKKSLLWDLAKETLAKQLGVEVTEEDYKQTARTLARQQFAQYGMANVPDDAVERFADDILKDKKSIDQIKARTADMKFFNALMQAVTLDEKTVSAEEFNALFKDEEVAE